MSDWAKVTLGFAAEIIMGQSPDGSTYNADGAGTPLINGPAEFGAKYPSAVQWTNSPTKTCQSGDVLFCVRGSTTGRMNVANDTYCIGRGVAAIRGRLGVATTPFLERVLSGFATEILEEAIGNGSTFPSVTGDRLRAKEFLLPSMTEQIRIVEILSALDDTIEQTAALIAKHQRINAGLMQDLFTRGITPDGHLRPTHSSGPPVV